MRIKCFKFQLSRLHCVEFQNKSKQRKLYDARMGAQAHARIYVSVHVPALHFTCATARNVRR